MPLDLVKEKIVLDNQAGEQSTQILLEGDIIVPDSKPDIDVILRCDGEVRLTDQTVNDGRVNFTGTLLVYVLYRADVPDRTVCVVDGTLPIEDVMQIEGIDKNSDVTITLELSHMDCTMVNDRKVGISAVVTVHALVGESYAGEVVIGVADEPELQILTGSLKLNNTVDSKKDRFTVREEVALPSGKPNIGEVLVNDVMITDQEVRPMDGRVMVRGNLRVSTLYQGEQSEDMMEVAEQDIPFSGYIESKEVTPQMFAQADLSVLQKNIHVMEDEDGEDRVLDTEVVVGADLKVTDSKEIEIIEDAYYPGRPLQIDRVQIHYPGVVGRNRNEVVMKEPVVLDPQAPSLLKIGKVWANVTVDDVTVKDDLVEVQGVVTMEALYVGEDDEAPVNVIQKNIPFTQEIEVKGAKEGDQATVHAAIEEASLDILSDREGEARVTLELDVVVLDEGTSEVVVGIDFMDDAEGNHGEIFPIASAMIYVVQRGDSLWTIAKEHETTIDDILSVNEIENPDLIYPGEKILILKRVVQ